VIRTATTGGRGVVVRVRLRVVLLDLALLAPILVRVDERGVIVLGWW
jgi:hypothetical protein